MSDILLKYISGMVYETEYARMYEHEETGIRCETHTERDEFGMATDKVETLWYHPSDKNTHSSFDEAKAALKE